MIFPVEPTEINLSVIICVMLSILKSVTVTAYSLESIAFLARISVSFSSASFLSARLLAAFSSATFYSSALRCAFSLAIFPSGSFVPEITIDIFPLSSTL